MTKYLLSLLIFFSYVQTSTVPFDVNCRIPYDVCCEFLSMNSVSKPIEESTVKGKVH